MGLSTVHSSPLQDLFPPLLPSNEAKEALGEYYRKHQAILSRSDLGYMTMADGRGGSGGVYVYEPGAAEVELAIGGSVAKIRPSGPVPGSGNEQPNRSKGDIVGFSKHSRRRLMRLIAGTERDKRPLFVTLTYSDEFSQDKARWKRDMDVFGKRFARAFEGSGFIWRMEFRERRTGSSAGLIAPHFHLLVWGVSITDFRAFGDKAWYDVVGSGDGKHLRAGVQSERVRKWGGTMAYVSKYIAKVEEFPGGWSGRVWGVVGRKYLPWAQVIVIQISDNAGVRLTRLARKMMGLKGRVLTFGVTILLNTERILDYLEWLEGYT